MVPSDGRQWTHKAGVVGEQTVVRRDPQGGHGFGLTKDEWSTWRTRLWGSRLRERMKQGMEVSRSHGERGQVSSPLLSGLAVTSKGSLSGVCIWVKPLIYSPSILYL